MRVNFFVAAVAALALLVGSCGRNSLKKGNDGTPVDVAESYDIKGVALEMKELPGGTLSLGTLADGRKINGVSAVHQVIIDGFAVSSMPVSQKLWTAVMGKNPSSVVNEGLPVDMVAYKDCEAFAAKLSRMTGLGFVIPTEAMWEFASDNGALTAVKGTREWTSDYIEEAGSNELAINPSGPENGKSKVVRTTTGREAVAEYTKAGGLTFRVAVLTNKPCDAGIVAAITGKPVEREHVSADEVIEVGGVKFPMKGIEGGSYHMGATFEQAEYGDENEKPVTQKEVEGFELGETEVTVGQWLAVFDTLPFGNDAKQPDKPVINVSWYAAQEFILKLNSLTGRKFRLPSEAEWEYAARGGKRTGNYRYAGSNQVASVAVYGENSGDLKVRNVKTKFPNELGLYDMSGNAWEWCQDNFGAYDSERPAGEQKVMRGGSAASKWKACRVSNRSQIPASNTKGTFGFRLAI